MRELGTTNDGPVDKKGWREHRSWPPKGGSVAMRSRQASQDTGDGHPSGRQSPGTYHNASQVLRLPGVPKDTPVLPHKPPALEDVHAPLPPHVPLLPAAPMPQQRRPIEDTVDMELPEMEEFMDAVSDVTKVHKQQLERLHTVNLELRKRLDQMVISTWNMRNDSWHGTAKEPEYGNLTLTCETKRKANVKWRVDEDTLMESQVDTTLMFQPREPWQHVIRLNNTWAQRLSEAYSTERSRRRTLMDGQSSPGTPVPLQRHRARPVAWGDPEAQIEDDAGGWLRHLIVSPSSNVRLAWDVASMILLIYDMVMIPIGFFEPPENTIITIMEWITLIYWTLDAPMSLLTGFVRKGSIVMVPQQIALHYLKTWFVLDLIVLVPDWVTTILKTIGGTEDANKEAGLAGLLRAVRIVRAIRLLRLAKLRKASQSVKDQISSEFVFIVISFLQLTAMILFMNHFLGSAFYMIGDIGKGAKDPTWIEKFGFEDRSLDFRYATSVHWALSKFALGSRMDISSPVTSGEVWFDVFVMVIGMSMFSLFLARSTTWLHQLNNLNGEFANQTWLLRRYLRDHGIDDDLRNRVMRYVEYKSRSSQGAILLSRITILNTLSENLYRELHFRATYATALNVHPLFERLEGVAQALVHSLVGHVLTTKAFAKADIIFQRSVLAPYSYSVCSGEAQYFKLELEDCPLVRRGDWLCEAALWTVWACRGDLEAIQDCEMILIDVQLFGSVMKENEDIFELIAVYATVYLEWLNQVALEYQWDLHICDIRKDAEASRNLVKEFMGST